MESPECWFEDFGSGRLANGKARMAMDPAFAHTIHTDEYHVFLEAVGESNGLFVDDKSPTGFTVREMGGGTPNVRFSYRLVGRRKDVVAPRLRPVTLPEVPEITPAWCRHCPWCLRLPASKWWSPAQRSPSSIR